MFTLDASAVLVRPMQTNGRARTQWRDGRDTGEPLTDAKGRPVYALPAVAVVGDEAVKVTVLVPGDPGSVKLMVEHTLKAPVTLSAYAADGRQVGYRLACEGLVEVSDKRAAA